MAQEIKDEDRESLVLRHVFEAVDVSFLVAFYGSNSSTDATRILIRNFATVDKMLTVPFAIKTLLPAVVDGATKTSAASRGCTGVHRGATMRSVQDLAMWVTRMMRMLDPAHLLPTDHVVRQVLAIIGNLFQSKDVAYVSQAEVTKLMSKSMQWADVNDFEQPDYTRWGMEANGASKMTPIVWAWEPECTLLLAFKHLEELTPITAEDASLARAYQQHDWTKQRLRVNGFAEGPSATQQEFREFCALDVSATIGDPDDTSPQRRCMPSVLPFRNYLDADGIPITIKTVQELCGWQQRNLKDLPRLRIDHEISAALGAVECDVRRDPDIGAAKGVLPLNVAMQIPVSGNLLATAMLVRITTYVVYKAISLTKSTASLVRPTTREHYRLVAKSVLEKHTMPALDKILDDQWLGITTHEVTRNETVFARVEQATLANVTNVATSQHSPLNTD